MKIAFFTDLHVLGTAAGYAQQPRFLNAHRQIINQLAERQQKENWAAILIGGDLVEEATREQISEAVDSLRPFTCPLLASLGNHDLNRGNALALWQELAPNCPALTLANTRLDLPNLTLFAMNNRWLDALHQPQLYWEPGKHPVATLTPSDLTWLDTQLSRGTAPVILSIHAPLHGIPPEQSGLEKILEPAPADYQKSLTTLLRRHPRVKLLLSGHNHIAHRSQLQHRHQLTTTAISETPHQYLLIDLHDSSITVTTEALGILSGGPDINESKRWVLGRDADRHVQLPWNCRLL